VTHDITTDKPKVKFTNDEFGDGVTMSSAEVHDAEQTTLDLAHFENLDRDGDGEIHQDTDGAIEDGGKDRDSELGDEQEEEKEEEAELTYEQQYGKLKEADEEHRGEYYYKTDLGESNEVGDGEVTRSSRVDTQEQVEMKAEYKKILAEYDATKEKNPGLKAAEILKASHLRGYMQPSDAGTEWEDVD